MVEENEPAGGPRELRLALALRGGASMAVWTGGAVAEIDRLRRAVGDDAAKERADAGPDSTAARHPWAALADLAGYESVSVDVLAGASAGGLNAALLAASIVYGFPFDSMRETWVRVADLEAMARPTPKLLGSAPESLLEGDDYFRDEVHRVLDDGIPAPELARTLGDRLDLLLTATLLDPVVERHLDSRFQPMVQERRSARFRFHHLGRPGDPFSDFGTGDGRDSGTLRLAHAGRGTSSFPFAFEPARVYSGAFEPPQGEPDMLGLFSETRPDPGAAGGGGAESGSATAASGAVRREGIVPEPRRVIDGGVLDNIPVGAAIDAIDAAPADRPTERWLLYLNPEPAVARRDRAGWRRLPLPVASAALRAKMSQETLLSDIAELRQRNEAVEHRMMQRASLLAPLRQAPVGERPGRLTELASEHFVQHAEVRARLDANAAVALLSDPAASEDGRLLPPVVGDPLAGWDERVRAVLAQYLADRMAERARAFPDDVFADAHALLSGVNECLAWARALEEERVGSDRSGTVEVGRVKAALYRLKVFGEVLAGHADRWWITDAERFPVTELDELGEWVDGVLDRRRRALHRVPAAARPALSGVLDRVRDGDGLADAEFQRWLATLAEQLPGPSMVDGSGAGPGSESSTTQAHTPEPGTVDAVAEANSVLLELAEHLAAVPPGEDWAGNSETVEYDLLARASGQRRLAVLHELVVLTAPLDTSRVAGAHIEFLRVAGDARSPLPFDALKPPDGPMRAEDKLRGTDLGHFGAFAAARWRANDWMWGRLDATTSLVKLLTDPDRLRARNEDLGAEGLGDAVQSIVSRPTRAELGDIDDDQARQWREFLAGRWAAHAGAVRAELDALFARPGDDHPMRALREAVTERLHWTIAAREVPFVQATGMGAEPGSPPRPPRMPPQQLERAVRGYDVGRQSVTDLGERRAGRIAHRLGLIAFGAARPGRDGFAQRLARAAATTVKPLVVGVVLAAAAPVRTALAGWLWMFGLLFAAWGSGPSDSGTGRLGIPLVADSGPAGWDFARLLVLVGFLALAGTAGWLLSRWWSGSGAVRGLYATAFVAVGLVAVLRLLSTGPRLGVVGVALLAGAVTWLLCFGYRRVPRLAAALLTAVVFVACAVAFAAAGWSPGWWLVASTALAGYAQMLLAGVIEVFPPRPRPVPTASAAGVAGTPVPS